MRERSQADAATPVCSWGAGAFTHAPPPPPPPPPPPTPATYTFADEFDGAAGTMPDATKWLWETGKGLWGNNEAETYVKSAANSYLDGNGHLVLAVTSSAAGVFNSARLNSAYRQLFGHWEARIAVPNVAGCWPAFWFLGVGQWPGCGEIDVAENYGTGYIDGSIWNGTATSHQFGRPAAPVDGGFHVYRVDWAKGSVGLFCDGLQYAAATSADLTPWPFDDNGGSHCLLNIAVGGNGTGGVLPNPALLGGAKMLVDYVHCWT